MLWPQDEGTTSGVMTAVRVRPMSDDERKAGCRNIITMVDNQTTVVDPAGLSPTSASSSSASSFRRRQSGQLNPANSSPSKLASMVHDSPTKRPSLSAEAKSSKVWSQSFTYDHSFWSCDPDHVHHADQQLVYDRIGTHVLSTAWNERLHVSLFAYGQTGAGKSFSMMGKSKSNHHEARGLVPRICHALFDAMQSSPPTVSATSTTSHVQTSSQIKDDGTLDKQTTASHPSPTCTVKMTFVEIYNERVYDLLDPHTKESLKVREHPANGTYVEHVSNLVVTSAHDIEYLVAEGNKTRTVAATSMNQLSSRSHAILTLTLHWLDKRLAPTKVCMVDLAGSERADVVACGDRLREAAAINKSLSALGDVINALAATTNHAAAGKSISSGFVQYRNSVLTRLLKDSLSGSGRLVMLAAISPCCIHYDETLSTLKYVERAKLAFVAQPSAQLQAVEASGAVDEGNAVMQLLRLELSMLRSQLRVAQQLGDLRPPSQVEEEVEIESSAQNVLDCTTLSVPHLVNLNQDPRYTERVVYCIEEGITTVGGGDAASDLVPDIVLAGHDMQPLHAILHCTNNIVRVRPAAVAAVRVNGRPILDTTELRHGARLMLGDHHVFRYDAAHTSERAPDMDWHGAHQELLDHLLTQGSHDDSNNVSISHGQTEPNDSAASLDVRGVQPTYHEAATQSDDGVTERLPVPPCIVVTESTQTSDYSYCTSTSTGTQYRYDAGIQFDEHDKFALERKLAKLKLLVKKKDKQLQKAARVKVHSLSLPCPPFEDAATTHRLLQLQHVVLSMLGTPPAATDQPQPPPTATLDDTMTALETQIHTLHEIWTDRPAASKPLAWLLQQLSSECNHQIALWSQAQTLQLSSAAKTIANLESRFASLCLALNEQCAQEKVHFIAAFDDQHTRHDKLVAAQATTLAFSANAHADSMALLQNTMTAKMEAAMDLHHADQQHWMDEIQAASHQHVETLKAMSVQAALDEDKLRVKMAEWEAKCASLVAEADMVLCETRAMHARELRGQQDAVALQLYDLEMLQMAQEERFLADTETFVRATDMTWRDRQLEQAAWTNQKQADLVALHIEHEGNVRQVQREHELKRDRLGEAVETIQMSHEERRHRWVATCDSVQNDIAEAKERHQVAVEAITLKHQASEAEHVQAMADRDVAWRELLAKFDTNATHESVQHARFMKQLVQRHHVEVQRVQDATIELEAALASQDAALMDRVRRWEDSFERLEVETQGRRQQVMDSHGNVLRDLDVAFEVQESTRRDERCRVDMQLCRQEAELRERASQQTMTFAMEMEDVRAKQWMQLSALVVVQDTRVTSTSDLVDSLRAEYDAKQRILDEQVEVLQVQCSDVERREIERHKQANQTHRDQMDGLRETWHEGLEQLMLSMEDERCRRMLQLERMHVHHEQALDTWNQAQELARQRILAQQRQHQRDVDAHLDAMQAAMDEVHFAHTTTMADIASHHSCILQDLRLLHAQAEEGWMQELEDSQRRQAWGYAQVAAQCADELWRGEQCIAVLHEAHAGAMATAQRELQIADETHEMWCMGVEDDSVRQLRQNELSLEAQWNDMQMDLNEREAQLHRQVQQLKAEADHDERSHEVTLQRAQEHWTEALSALSMEKEDVLSSHLSQLTLVNDRHLRAVERIRVQLAQHEGRAVSQQERATSSVESTRALTLSLSQNQQAFYDEAAASIEIKWIETQAKHTAQLAMERESHARMFHLLAEAHAAQRRELASDKSALEQTLGAQLAAYERDLAVEMQAALRKLSIQDEKWQDEVMVDLDGGYRQMCAALAADAASQEAAFKKQLQDVQDQWRTELANIHLELQDISSHHMLSLEKCQALFERDLQCIAQKELEIDMRTHMERREAAERAAMAQAEKDGMEGRLRAIRYDLTQRQRQRHDEFDLVSRDFLQKTLDAHKDKERVRRRCLAELQALERLHTRDLRAQVPLGPVKNSIPKSDLEGQQKLVRSRIKEELVRSTGHLIEVEYASNMDMLESVHRAQANKLEMAMEDEQSRMWERRRRALAFLDEPPPKMPDVMLLSRPSSPSTHDMSDKCMAPSYLLPIELDVTRFPHLAMRPRHMHPKDQAIAAQLKQNGELVHRLEAERRQFTAKTDETSRALAKMQASMSSLEEMMRVADEKAKEDASVIQMLQDKAKSCVVELPTREVVASTFTVATKDTTNSSAPKANLLRGWK